MTVVLSLELKLIRTVNDSFTVMVLASFPPITQISICSPSGLDHQSSTSTRRDDQLLIIISLAGYRVSVRLRYLSPPTTTAHTLDQSKELITPCEVPLPLFGQGASCL